jgi:predicted RNA-binding protein with PIN domain
VERLIVDGMNVIGSRPDGWWRDRPGAMRRLAARLAAYARATGEPLTVVFDGRPVDVGQVDGLVEVAFAPGGPNAADDEIVRRAAASPDPVTVVTSDRGLRSRLADLGARVEPVSAFRRKLDEVVGPDR